jgi:hypothetical protein
LKFFLPEWDDRVDPGYDFLTDRPTLQRDPYRDDLYAHELFDEPVYDGLLVSRMALNKNSRKHELAERMGLKSYLRMPPDLELLGDCGAFGYVAERDPSFTTEEILEYYDRLGFDYGVSVDHIVLPEFADQRDYRYDLTLRNAEDFLRLHRAEGLQFTPLGAVQGWDAESYAEAASALVDFGYDYVAVGGLARSNTRQVSAILQAVVNAVPESTRIHVFGIARASMLPLFVSLGIESADSAAPLRQAWLSAKDNYYMAEGTHAAIRIPTAKEDRGVSQTLVGRSEATFADLRDAERAALTAVREYARRESSIKDTLDAVKAYDSLLGARLDETDAKRRYALYRQTLKARPWDHCKCPICTEIGVETVIFRGNNRNRRRGFHNLWVLRRRIEQALESPSEPPVEQGRMAIV